MGERLKVLFLCTGNACRSQMAEAMLRHVGADRFVALSAGSHPAGFIHSLVIEVLGRMEIPLENQRSKGWDEFADERLDAVITLCDAAASQSCPAWAGAPIRAHWPLPDPSYYPGNDEDRVEFAARIAQRLYAKILALVALDWSSDRVELEKQLQALGQI